MGSVPIQERRKHFRVEDEIQIRHHEITADELADLLDVEQSTEHDTLMLVCCPEGKWANDILSLGKQRLCGKVCEQGEAITQSVSLSVGGLAFSAETAIAPDNHLVLELTGLASNERIVILASIVDCHLENLPSTYRMRVRFDAMTQVDHDWLEHYIDEKLANVVSQRGINLKHERKLEQRRSDQ